MKKFFCCFMLSMAAVLFMMPSCANAQYIDMDVVKFGQLLQENKAALIDVRTAEEFEQGHIAGAVNYDFYASEFVQMVSQNVEKDKPLALYCRSGRRSAEAAKLLNEAGYTVYNLDGGYNGWRDSGRRVTKYEVDIFKTPKGSLLYLYLIKHGSVAIEYDSLFIQVDPVAEFGKHTDYSVEFPKADVILVTHEHADHLEDSTIKVLTKEDTRLILNKTSADKIGRGEIIANGESLELPKGIRLEAVPAYNTTAGREKFHPKGNGNGYLLTIDGFRIYIAGDTEDVPEMANLKDIDVALLPVNQPYTMTVEQCANAANMIMPKVLIPYHFSKTDLSPLQGMIPKQKILFRQMQ